MPAAKLPPVADEMPAAHAGVTIPEGFEIDQATFVPIAREMAREGYSKAQVEHALATHAKLEIDRTAAKDRAYAAEDRRWRQEAEKALEAPGARGAGPGGQGDARGPEAAPQRRGLGEPPRADRLAGAGRPEAGPVNPMKREIATSLQRALAALRAHHPTTARRELEPLGAIIRVDGALGLIRDGRHRTARDMITDLLPALLPAVDDFERALRQRDRQLEGAGWRSSAATCSPAH